LVKRLVFSKEYREVLLKRGKVTTIRRRPLASPGEYVDVYAGEEMVGRAMIEKIIEKKVSELSNVDARRDGFRNIKELKRALRKHYKDLDEDSIIYVHFLKWIEQ